VADRPGVPPDLKDRYWFTPWGFAGSVGSTLQLKVPDGEVIVAVGSNFLVSALELSEEGSVGTRLVIRTFHDAQVVRSWDSDLIRVQGLLVGTRLFWTGLSGAGIPAGGATFTDGGIWTLDLAIADDKARSVLPAGADIHSYGANAERAPLAASPTGRTVASRVGGFDGTRADIIDVRSLSIRSQLEANVVTLTDEVAVVYPSDQPSRIDAVDLDSAKPLWSLPSSQFGLVELESMYAFDHHIAVGYHRVRDGSDDAVISIVEAGSGASRDLYVVPYDDALHLAPPLSTPSQLALMPTFWDTAIQGGEPVSLLDVATGSLLQNAFRIIPQ
jgi:hypothetical protein